MIMQWVPYLFPLLFLAMWFAVTTLIGFMSGWFSVQDWYADDGSEAPLLTLRGLSGTVGRAGFGGGLQLRAYPASLGIRVLRLLGPFQKPLKVRWSEIEAVPVTRFLLPMVELRLGAPPKGTLRISAGSWARLVDAVPNTATGPGPGLRAAAPVERKSLARAMFLQWLAVSVFVGAFFYLAQRANGAAAWPPLAVCVGFPATVFGIGQLVRYLRER
jgi:hypothetical protein